MKLVLQARASLHVNVRSLPGLDRTGGGREGHWGSTVSALLHFWSKTLSTKHFKFKPEPSRLSGREVCQDRKVEHI